MGCCLSRVKHEISNSNEEPKSKISEYYYEDRMKSMITIPESNNIEEGNLKKTKEDREISEEFLNHSTIENDNLDLPISKPDLKPLKSPEKKIYINKLNQNSPSSNKNCVLEENQNNLSFYEVDKRMGMAPEENVINKIDIIITLISFEFICENFIEIFKTKFCPIFELNFQNYSRNYKNILKKESILNNATSPDSESNILFTNQNLGKNAAKNNTINNSNLNFTKLGSNQNLSENKSEILNSNDTSIYDLINNSKSLNTKCLRNQIPNKFSDPKVEFIFPNKIGEILQLNEFQIKGLYKREIYSPINFILMNKSNDDDIGKQELVIAKAYLPINYLFVSPKISDIRIKIPIQNTIEDIIIGYLNISINDNNSEFHSVNTIDPEISIQKINNFYLSKNIQRLNDIDHMRLQKKFIEYKFNCKDKTNLFNVKFTQANANCTSLIYNHLSNSNLKEIEQIIFLKKKDKIYDMKLYNYFNYYTFLTVLNEIFGKLKGCQNLDEFNKNEQIIENLKSLNKKFFNTQFFHLDVCEMNSFNILILNNFLSLFCKIKKEKLVDLYADDELKEQFSIKNIFESYGRINIKITKKIYKCNLEVDNTKNQINSSFEYELIIFKNIRDNFICVINNVLEDYIRIGMNPNKSNSFVTNKMFYFEEIKYLKYNIKNYILKDYEFFLNDSNFTIGILKLLVNFVKFLKSFCYANKLSHNDVYINEYIFKDNSLVIWFLFIFNKFINNPRFFPTFLEFINEFIEEIKGVYFSNFKKYFEIPLFSMNFLPYLQTINKKNILMWFLISNIFLKFSQNARSENFQFYDFLGLSNKEVQIIIINCFNMLVILSKDDFMRIDQFKFKEELENDNYGLSYISQNNKQSKFLLSSYHIKIFTKIIETLSNLIINYSQFLNYINLNISNYQNLIKFIVILVLLKFDSDKYLNKTFIKNRNLFFDLYKNILIFIRNLMKFKYLNLIFFILHNSILKEILPKFEVRLMDKQITFENLKENLKVKLENCLDVNNDKDNKNKEISILKKIFEDLDKY